MLHPRPSRDNRLLSRRLRLAVRARTATAGVLLGPARPVTQSHSRSRTERTRSHLQLKMALGRPPRARSRSSVFQSRLTVVLGLRCWSGVLVGETNNQRVTV